MRVVLVPEPVDWLSQVEARRVTPWALPFRAPGGFFRRRYLPTERGWLGWTALEIATRLWAGSSTARHFQARFALRGLASRLVRPPAEAEMVAPSLAALEIFARHRGRKILLLDLPLLRQLNEDLDVATRAHPQSDFLRRFRAPRALLIRQECEIALADEIWVRGHHVADCLSGRGGVCLPFPGQRSEAQTKEIQPGQDILLAGLATSRHGIYEMLELLERHPHWRLRVRVGEGMEPKALLSHPRVERAQGFQGVGVVVAPSWVEFYPAELEQASTLGLPVIASRQAAGFTPVTEVKAGDLEALEAALLSVLGV